VRATLALAELEPSGHVKHVLAPTVEYVPAPHCVHRPPFAPEEPALQVHAASAELALGELELAGHARHVAAAVALTAVEYVFAAQTRHADEPVKIL
jgi:hypothetical protein